jgi:hypothetical protein
MRSVPRGIKTFGLMLAGTVSLVFGAIDTVYATGGYCTGVVHVTGGYPGTGGSLTCTSHSCTGGCSTSTYYWASGHSSYCTCNDNSYPADDSDACCHIAFVYEDGIGWLANPRGYCNASDPPCPLTGECQRLGSYPDFTAECY